MYLFDITRDCTRRRYVDAAIKHLEQLDEFGVLDDEEGPVATRNPYCEPKAEGRLVVGRAVSEGRDGSIFRDKLSITSIHMTL